MDQQTFRSAAALIGAGIVTFGGLWLLSQPSHARTRLANVAAVAERVEQAEAGVAPPLATPCRTSLTEGADQLGASLRTAAAQSRVNLQPLELAVLPAPTTDLQGLKVAIRLRGDEAALAAFLRRASEARLPIFIDSADIRRTAAGGLSAEFNARLLCRRGGQ